MILFIPLVQRLDRRSLSFVNCSRFVVITWSQTRFSRNAAIRRLFIKYSRVYLFTSLRIFTPNMMDATVIEWLLKFHVFYLKSSSAVAMSLPQKSQLPILERTNVCYSCNLQKETYSRRKEDQFRAPDMHMPVIEINLHNIYTMYQKQRLFSYICKCLQKLIIWSI